MRPQTVYGLAVTPIAPERKALITFSLPGLRRVMLKVKVYNGREVRLLVNEILREGPHEALFDYGALPAEEYIICLLVNTPESIDMESQNIKIP